jgi:para-aminobenzoate synthetase/4-amino-4-deoxychorismate lyase
VQGESVQHLVVVCGSLHLCGQVLAACDPFDLLETLRWEGRVGEGGTFVLLDHHLQRLRRACLYFGFCPDSAAVDILVDQVRDRLDAAASEWAHDTSALARRVRVLVGPHGRVEVQSVEMIDAAPLVTDLSFRRVAQTKSASAAAAPSSPVALLPRTVRVRIAQGPVLRDNPFVRWKTTHRQVYATALNDVRTAEAQQGASEAAEDVILFNQFGQVTESTIANIAIVRSKAHQDGAFPEEEVVTPPVECGLLAGTMRRALLEAGWMIESPVTLADLKSAREILLFNSVRGIYRAHLLPSP